MNISVEARGVKPVRLTVEIDLIISPYAKEVDLEKIAEEATREAFRVSNNYMRKLL